MMFHYVNILHCNGLIFELFRVTLIEFLFDESLQTTMANESDLYGVADDYEDAYCDGFADNFHDSADDIVWLANVICIPTIAAVGLVCNGLNLLILLSNRTAKRMPSWTFLLALAACDCFFLLFATFEVMPNSIASFASSPSFNRFYVHSVLYVRTLASTFYKTSVL
jgi:hypothetical protein